MDNLKKAQAEIHEALIAPGEPECFLRICTTPDALWVCDLPRKCQRTASVEERLNALGVCCSLTDAKLWKLDWRKEQYKVLASLLPTAVPPMPREESWHELYALCRLLLLHPVPLADQPMDAVRMSLKLPYMTAAEQHKTIRALHGQCAIWLREHQPLPAMAGGVLAEWLK